MTNSGVNICTADEAAVDLAAERLAKGGLVAFPTETVYGLGADASSGKAVARIFEAKGRPQFNPLIVHLADASLAAAHATLPHIAVTLAAEFWPGPLTLVLPCRPSQIDPLVTAGGDTIALRVPGHPVAQALLRRVDRPIAAPSANRSGGVSPTTADHVRASLGDRVDLILDGGPCPGGLESTIVDLTGDAPVMLRPGLIDLAALAAVVGDDILDPPSDGAVRAPGMLVSHYAPLAQVRINAKVARPGEAFLAYGPGYPETGSMLRNLSPGGDLVEAAANLFAMLHDLDRMEIAGIAVAPIPEVGLGVPINDRLRRAAALRPDSGGALPEGHGGPKLIA